MSFAGGLFLGGVEGGVALGLIKYEQFFNWSMVLHV